MHVPKALRSPLARKMWVAYATATILVSLSVLAIYVNAYDDNGLTDRLRAIGSFTRQAMRLVSFPLGLPFGALANGPLQAIFGCDKPNEPCGVFVDWWTHFAALVAQIISLRLMIREKT